MRYKLFGDNCQRMVDAMAIAARVRRYIPHLGGHPRRAFDYNANGADQTWVISRIRPLSLEETVSSGLLLQRSTLNEIKEYFNID